MRYLLFILMSIVGPAYGQTTQNTTDFVITVKTDNVNATSSDSKSFHLPTSGIGYNYTVDWNNDGQNISTGVTGDITHTFSVAGTYTIRISGNFPQICFGYVSSLIVDSSKLLSIQQWGSMSWRSFNRAFVGCDRLVINALDNPDLSIVNDLGFMFFGCSSINNNIENWNTSSITNMSFMFYSCTNFNQDISNWNTSSVINMSDMFYGCINFNQDIGKWNTASVTNMYQMFALCTIFNKNIGGWNTGAVTTMNSMMIECTNFNQDIGNWNTSAVKNISQMFLGAELFNQNIGNWNTTNITDMTNMFSGCSSFNQNIGNWNTSNVTNMSGMFNGCTGFNQNIGNWNTISVQNMSVMFSNCANFNQDIGKWDISNVTNLEGIFFRCTNFNSNVGNWNTNSVTSMNAMFNSCTNFNQDIGNWNTSKVTDMGYMFGACTNFNQDITNWNTNNVTTMAGIFVFCTNFNQDIGNWNTAKVTNMSDMFNGCINFNHNIGNWNTGNVTNMEGMFYGHTNFNQSLEKWNTGNVTNMESMFYRSTNFNQSLGKWNIGKVVNMTDMLVASGLSFNNYDTTLTGWQASAHQSNISLDAGGLSYCAAVDKHKLLTTISGWTITGDHYLNTSTTHTLLYPNTLQFTNTISCIDPATGFMQFVNNVQSPTIKYLALNPNSNTGYNFNLTEANNLPVINNQMRTDGTANTTALSNGIYTIVDAGINNYPSGMTVRIYYSSADSTAAMSMLDSKVNSPITSQWFKFSGTTHTANVNNILANQTINNITGATFLTPSAYGTEKNSSYVEFSNIKNFGSFGFLAARTANVLPITLTSFTATANKCAVSLVWKVAHEENSSYYAIETSKNGKDFIQVTKVESNNSNNGGTYGYNYVIDNGTHYFRLRSVDTDGKFVYSQTDVATIHCINEGGVTVSPNPASEQILVQGLSTGSYITLHDLMGKIIIKTKVRGTSETINIGKYAKGIYLLSVKAANGAASTIKVVRQ